MADLHPNALAVQQAAAELGLEISPITFPEGTRTAEDAANAIGCGIGQIVKSLIFSADGEIVVALVSGSNQLDERKLAAACGAAKTKRADADSVRNATGYPIGGVPPFGHATALRCFVDPDLLVHDVVWAAAGTPHSVFAIAPDHLVSAIGAVVSDLRR